MFISSTRYCFERTIWVSKFHSGHNQGSTNDNWTKAYNIDTIPTYSATALTPFALFDNANFLNYRLKATGLITDTVLIKNVLFIYKR